MDIWGVSKKQQKEGKKWGKSAKIWGNFKLQYIKLETKSNSIPRIWVLCVKVTYIQ